MYNVFIFFVLPHYDAVEDNTQLAYWIELCLYRSLGRELYVRGRGLDYAAKSAKSMNSILSLEYLGKIKGRMQAL